jgi:serine/threonine-protein kinase HipA
MINPTEYESNCQWHNKCIKKFFGTIALPEIDINQEEIEEIASNAVNKRLTVPGVQKKLSLHLSKEDGIQRLTIVDYPTGYILKPQSQEYEALPEAEFLVMKMAEASKIKTVPNALIKVDGGFSYITKRVDRIKNGMLAMEDFCQLSGRVTADKYKSSYESCGKIVKNFARNSGLDMADIYYRILFCFATGNSDMHLKNFSLIEDKPGSRIYGLSPAYDLLPVNVIVPADKEQMALTVNGKKRNIRKKDFLALASTMGLAEKTTTGLMKRIAGLKDEYLRMIEESYLSDEMKKTFIDLTEKRIAILE